MINNSLNTKRKDIIEASINNAELHNCLQHWHHGYCTYEKALEKAVLLLVQRCSTLEEHTFKNGIPMIEWHGDK